jgi:NadR type nicotinamide-nucleotide adenylyltransferase
MLKKVVVIGPESTGKSTISEALAGHFGCPWVPEFAREYLENLGRPYLQDDLLEIAKGQISLEEHQARKAQDLLVCDTDLHVVKVWSQHKFEIVDPWIEQEIKTRTYDLYLLTDIDIPWQDDPLREHPAPEMRSYFFGVYVDLLKASGTQLVILSGSLSERIEKAILHIEALLGKE